MRFWISFHCKSNLSKINDVLKMTEWIIADATSVARNTHLSRLRFMGAKTPGGDRVTGDDLTGGSVPARGL